MTKLNLLLAAALVGSSLLLVRTAYESRLVFTALDRAKREQGQLEAEHARLSAERQTQATHQKVGRVASERLKMTAPAATLYVDAPTPTANSLPPLTPTLPAPTRTAAAALHTGPAR
jgi:cell division protein FtsL